MPSPIVKVQSHILLEGTFDLMKKKSIILLTILAIIAVISLLSCKNPAPIDRADLIKIRNYHNEIYLTGVSGQGLSSLSYSLKQSQAKDMIAFLINNKRIFDPTLLNDPNFGIEKCQFLREENLVVGATCILDLGKLDSANNSGVEKKVISYFNGKDEMQVKKRIAWNSFSPSYIIIEKSGPFLRLNSERLFFIQNEGDVFYKKRYIIEPIAKKVKKNQVFSLGVNEGNKLFTSKISWEKQAENLEESGLSCIIEEGLNGLVNCKVTSVRKMKKNPARLYLGADRHGKKAVYSVEIRGARSKDKPGKTEPSAEKPAFPSQASR